MGQPLSPEDIERTQFATALRGYDKDEVDAFLVRAGDGFRAALDEARERAYQNLGDKMGSLLQHAKDDSEEMIAKAQAEAKQTRESADADAAQTRAEADADAAKARQEATDDAARMRQEATDDAARMRAEAEKDAAQMRAEATDDAARMRQEATDDAARRTKEADDRVRDLQAAESDVRQELRRLRLRMLGLSDQLEQLDKHNLTSIPQAGIESENGATGSFDEIDEGVDEAAETVSLTTEQTRV